MKDSTLHNRISVSPSTYSALRFMCRDYYVKYSDASCPHGRLLGLCGLVSIVGEELAVRLFSRAQRSKSDKITCKLRRGAVVTFYNK